MTVETRTQVAAELPQASLRRMCFRKWASRLTWTLLALCALLFAAYTLRAPLLSGAARLWIVNDPLEHADAIVILGGGLDTRPFEAARLYRAGLAPLILLMKAATNSAEALGVTLSDSELARRVLLTNGVPLEAIKLIDDRVTNTRDEAVAVRKWAEANHARRIIIPTDIFHTRRVRWIFSKALRGKGAQVSVEAVHVRRYSAVDWWQHEESLIAFQNEVVKSMYYHLKY
jgi:uncharacterized SAM-binding protein YcdF (DUF218 family)